MGTSGCFCRGLECEFGSQHPHSASQPAVTPDPQGPKALSGLWGHLAHTWCTHICAGKILTHIKEGNAKKTLRKKPHFDFDRFSVTCQRKFC